MQYFHKFNDPRSIEHWFRNSSKYSTRTVYVPSNVDVPQKSISVCITCMNRLYDLKNVLPQNLLDSKDYAPAEFVILDYNSQDGLEEWIKKEMMGEILSGRIVYCRTTDPQYFCYNHSRNLCFRMASNEIIANVDADNLMHPGYLQRINQCLSIANQKVIAVPENFLQPNSTRMLLKGRFAIHKRDMQIFRGYDEDLDEGFGYDDVNFLMRVMLAGFTLSRFEAKFTETHQHSSTEEHVRFVKNKDIKQTLARNANITINKLNCGRISVNPNGWGEAKVTRYAVPQ